MAPSDSAVCPTSRTMRNFCGSHLVTTGFDAAPVGAAGFRDSQFFSAGFGRDGRFRRRGLSWRRGLTWRVGLLWRGGLLRRNGMLWRLVLGRALEDIRKPAGFARFDRQQQQRHRRGGGRHDGKACRPNPPWLTFARPTSIPAFPEVIPFSARSAWRHRRIFNREYRRRGYGNMLLKGRRGPASAGTRLIWAAP